MKARSILFALALCPPAIAATDSRPVHHYARSNSDGSEREDVIIFKRSATDIDVLKAKSRCTNAAYVTAKLDAASGQTRSLVGGRLLRDGTQQAFAWLDHKGGRLIARLGAPDADPIFDIAAGPRWVLYDFDFSDLIAQPPAEIAARKDWAFELPLLLTGDGEPTMSNRGMMQLRFVRIERHNGKNAARYEAGGPALSGKRGNLWFDAKNHALIEAQLPIANHSEYTDFRLRLIKTERGHKAWDRRKATHWAGCPPPIISPE
jgi:hypothetical protein